MTKQEASAATVTAFQASRHYLVALPTGVAARQPGYDDVIAIPKAETVNNDTLGPVQGDGRRLHMLRSYRAHGYGSIQQDYSHAVFGQFPLMFALIAFATFVLLVRAFRSLLLAVKTVLLNLVSLAATFRLITWFWRQGHIRRRCPTSRDWTLSFWIPLMIFAFLFGLSMDYEVFILGRVREEYGATGSTNKAVVGRRAHRPTRHQRCADSVHGFPHCIGAEHRHQGACDGSRCGHPARRHFVRALLVPALVSLFGRYNWWLPAWLAKPLRVAPSPLPPRNELADAPA